MNGEAILTMAHRAIENEADVAHDVANGLGQCIGNVAHTTLFSALVAEEIETRMDRGETVVVC